MSYEKTTWQNGDIITAEKLNNIEDGIENNELNNKCVIVSTHYDPNNDSWLIIDKTYNEILNMIVNGYFVSITIRYGGNNYRQFPIYYIGSSQYQEYVIMLPIFNDGGQVHFYQFTASNSDDYPKMYQD